MKYYVGIDVSKLTLDIYWGEDYIQVSNDKAGLNVLHQTLKVCTKEGHEIALIVCEASGGYEKLLIKFLYEKGYPVHVAHANKVRSFAKSKGWLAKTDKIDAKVISIYAKVMDLTADKFQLSGTSGEIKDLIKRREELLNAKQSEQNRLDKCTNKEIKKSIEAHIRWLGKALDSLGESLKKLSKIDDIKETYKLLMSVPAVGLITASYIISYLPELGSLTHKKIAALVGVAPFNHDSGKTTGKRYIQGGRKRLRNIVYMAALVSIRWNKDLKIFYKRLRESGKPAKLALTAVMRKLLTILNRVMMRKTAWQSVAPIMC